MSGERKNSPEVHRLEPNLALPHPLEPALLLLLGGAVGRALPPFRPVEARLELRAEGAAAGEGGGLLAEQGPRGAEDGVCC